MTPHHIQTLKYLNPECTMYFPTIPKRCKLPHYRPKPKDERCLSQQAFKAPPSIRELSRRQDKNRIRSHLATQETTRTRQMLSVANASRDLSDPRRLRHKPHPRRHAPRTQIHNRPEQAPAAAAAAPAGPLASPAPPQHIAQ